MDLTIIRIVLLASSLWGVQSLEITNLTVPAFVENGTQEFVLLDCEYNYDDKDKNLLVKWFHDNDPVPVYQWITETGSTSSTHKFEGRVSENYNVGTGDTLTEFRALHMLWPTTEMSGTYSCQVTSTEDTVSREADMTIYAKPKSFSINVTSLDDTVYVTCIVENVFPVPEIEMFHIEPGQMDSDPVETVYQSYVEDGDAFDVFLKANISESEFESDGLHFFGCTVSLEGTEYKEQKSTPFNYEAGANQGYDQDVDDDNGDGALNMLPSAVTILMFASALLLLSW